MQSRVSARVCVRMHTMYERNVCGAVHVYVHVSERKRMGARVHMYVCMKVWCMHACELKSTGTF